MREWALGELRKAGNPRSRAAKVQAILDGYRARVQYVPDPVMVEFMASPVATLCLDDEGLCLLGGDCDDAAITINAAGMSIGIPMLVVGAAYDGSDVPTHVYSAFLDEGGRRVRADATTSLPVGQAHRASREWWIDPLDELDPSGMTGGEFVGISGPPKTIGSAMHEASEWGELRHSRRVLGVGWAWPSEVLNYMQQWGQYVEATVAALRTCAAAQSDSAVAQTMTTNAHYLETMWHAYDSYDGYDFTNNAAQILVNLQQAIYAAGLFTNQASGCPGVEFPQPVPLPEQSELISALENAGYIAIGQLELLTAAAGGVIVATGEVAREAVHQASGLGNFLQSPYPWIAVTALAGAFVVIEAWPRRRT